MEKLSDEQVKQYIADLPQWSLNGDLLQRTFRFDDFAGSMAYANRVAALADEMKHHPDIMIRYNKVTLTLTTHDAGGLTERDFSFARSSDGCLTADKEA